MTEALTTEAPTSKEESKLFESVFETLEAKTAGREGLKPDYQEWAKAWFVGKIPPWLKDIFEKDLHTISVEGLRGTTARGADNSHREGKEFSIKIMSNKRMFGATLEKYLLLRKITADEQGQPLKDPLFELHMASIDLNTAIILSPITEAGNKEEPAVVIKRGKEVSHVGHRPKQEILQDLLECIKGWVPVQIAPVELNPQVFERTITSSFPDARTR